VFSFIAQILCTYLAILYCGGVFSKFLAISGFMVRRLRPKDRRLRWYTGDSGHGDRRLRSLATMFVSPEERHPLTSGDPLWLCTQGSTSGSGDSGPKGRRLWPLGFGALAPRDRQGLSPGETPAKVSGFGVWRLRGLETPAS
jgi:hypothetical protein